jgi:uncharacterized protein with GYD domain
MGFEIKFENFKMEGCETIKEMYNRLMAIQDEFSDLGKPLINNKVLDKILRMML